MCEFNFHMHRKVFTDVLHSESEPLRAAPKEHASFITYHDLSLSYIDTQSTPMASPLTDKFPPELRIRIYRQVLQFDSPLLIANKSYPEEPK